MIERVGECINGMKPDVMERYRSLETLCLLVGAQVGADTVHLGVFLRTSAVGKEV